MKKIGILGAALFLLFSCSVQKRVNTSDLVNATAWTQTSGEYPALSLQAFHLARLRLDDILKDDHSTKPKAIVLDIDETVLDNSPYQGFQIERNRPFNDQDWYKWTHLAQAEPLAGAVEFLNYAQDRKIEIFYLSNRVELERKATLKNLKVKGFPFADNQHLIVKTNTSSKTERRAALAEKYNIVLFFGDNLSDFSDIYYHNDEGKTAKEKVMENPEVFGSKFIVLPNPMYGDWETSLYKENTNKKLSNEAVKRRAIRSF